MFYRQNDMAINLALVESAELDGSNLLLHTSTGNTHRIPFDTVDEAERVLTALSGEVREDEPARAPASRRKPRSTR